MRPGICYQCSKGNHALCYETGYFNTCVCPCHQLQQELTGTVNSVTPDMEKEKGGAK
jgi:hypothetical protein